MAKVIWHGEIIKGKMRRAVPKALMIVGAQAVTLVKELVPVDTGLLKSSITFATSLGREKATTEKGVLAEEKDLIEKPDDKLSLKIGTAVEYAPHVEFGTVKMKRQPFLRLGILSNRNVLGRLFAKAMRGLVK